MRFLSMESMTCNVQDNVQHRVQDAAIGGKPVDPLARPGAVHGGAMARQQQARTGARGPALVTVTAAVWRVLSPMQAPPRRALVRQPLMHPLAQALALV